MIEILVGKEAEKRVEAQKLVQSKLYNKVSSPVSRVTLVILTIAFSIRMEC